MPAGLIGQLISTKSAEIEILKRNPKKSVKSLTKTAFLCCATFSVQFGFAFCPYTKKYEPEKNRILT